MDVCLLCLYVVLSCVGRRICNGLITRPEESYRVCVLTDIPKRGPVFHVGNERKINDEWQYNKVSLLHYYWDYKITAGKTDGTSSMDGEKQNSNKITKVERYRPMARPRLRWETGLRLEPVLKTKSLWVRTRVIWPRIGSVEIRVSYKLENFQRTLQMTDC
jgi:hypothetical protein